MSDGMPSSGQADLQLPAGGVVALDEVPSLWHDMPRWGHRMHALCSYFAMLPNSMVNVLVQWLSSEGDVVYDPFSGSGKIPFEARRLGREAWGADLNPLAVVLTRAKLADVTTSDILARLDDLEIAVQGARPQLSRVPSHVRMLMSDHTLRQLLALRSRLNVCRGDDAFIMAMILGILHLNATKDGTPRGLTVSMPNTFAMAPGYVRRYIEEHELVAPDVDVIPRLRERLKLLDLESIRGTSGLCLYRDATWRSPHNMDGHVRLMLSSPPYLDVIKYAKFNWIRLWMLGREPKSVDSRLMSSGSLKRYLSFMSTVLNAQAPVMHKEGLACLVIGDVRREDGTLHLAQVVADEVERRTGWRKLAIIADELPQDRKVSRIWGVRRGLATKTDRILILRPPDGTAELPVVPKISWAL